MRALVTGADGFVATWLIPRLLADGYEIVAAVRPGQPLAQGRDPAPAWVHDVRAMDLELRDDASVQEVLSEPYDAVVHLAAVSSGVEAQRDISQAWEVNAVGTARLAEELGRLRVAHDRDPILLVTSTAEVYGAGRAGPRVEDDVARPCSPYAASKLAAEIAALEVHRRTGLRVVITRAFAHTGAGQDSRFVVPAFAQRLLTAKRLGAPVVKVGNLEPVREFLHVSDVVEAYVRLLEQGEPGAVYNVASGSAVGLADLFHLLAEIVGHRAIAETDPELVRRADILHLVGDASKLRKLTGWEPRVSLRETLTEVVDAQAD